MVHLFINIHTHWRPLFFFIFSLTKIDNVRTVQAHGDNDKSITILRDESNSHRSNGLSILVTNFEILQKHCN